MEVEVGQVHRLEDQDVSCLHAEYLAGLFQHQFPTLDIDAKRYDNAGGTIAFVTVTAGEAVYVDHETGMRMNGANWCIREARSESPLQLSRLLRPASK